MILRLTKTKDTKFEGRHPNEIHEGYVVDSNAEWNEEELKEKLIVNLPFVLSHKFSNIFYTSPVTEINWETKEFKTTNSIYKWEFIES